VKQAEVKNNSAGSASQSTTGGAASA